MGVEKGITIAGGIGIVVALAIVTIGLIMIVRSIIKRNKNGGIRKPMLIWGIILSVLGFGALFTCFVVFVLGGISTATLSSTDVTKAAEKIEEALEENDKEAIRDMIAEKGFSGDVPTSKEVDKLFSKIDGEIDDSYIDVRYSGYHGNLTEKIVTMKFGPFTTDEDEEYYLEVDYVTKADDEDYEGIQYIALFDDDGLIYEAGTETDYEELAYDNDRK